MIYLYKRTDKALNYFKWHIIKYIITSKRSEAFYICQVIGSDNSMGIQYYWTVLKRLAMGIVLILCA